MAWLTIWSTAGVVLCTCLGYVAQATYNHRRKVNELRMQGIPMPKGWNWFTGHLLVLQKYVDGIPPDAAVVFALRDLAHEFADTEVFFMDFWPVYPALLTIFGPESIDQVCNKYNLPKTATAAWFMKPVAGGPNLVSMNGEEWKYWRSLFNPGFSSGAMLNNVPHIVDSVLVFRQKLIEMIGKGMFSLDEFAMRLTMEVILKVTLDDSSNYQRSPHVLATSLGKIVAWHSFWDPRKLMNPLRPLVQAYHGNVMNRYIRKELDQRFKEVQAESLSSNSNAKSPSNKSVIALAIKAYMTQANNNGIVPERIDDTFCDYATWQIRVFLFAGNDSTASIMVYVYHMLSKHANWLQKLRQEHDEVFGENTANAARLLKDDPALLNKCTLTLAFIKETLRLWAPAGTMRAGLPGIHITDLQGNEQPMQFAGANVLHQALHLNPRVWPRPEEFLPERFLVEQGHELHPDPAAFRPFELGPRNCIGQTLVWNELKVAVILTCRDLELHDAYAELDAKREREMGVFGKLRRKMFGEPVKTLHGERAYQTDTGGSHPVDGYPCNVTWVRDRRG